MQYDVALKSPIMNKILWKLKRQSKKETHYFGGLLILRHLPIISKATAKVQLKWHFKWQHVLCLMGMAPGPGFCWSKELEPLRCVSCVKWRHELLGSRRFLHKNKQGDSFPLESEDQKRYFTNVWHCIPNLKVSSTKWQFSMMSSLKIRIVEKDDGRMV